MQPSDLNRPYDWDRPEGAQPPGPSARVERIVRMLRSVPTRWAWIAIGTVTAMAIAAGLLTPSTSTPAPGRPTPTVSLTPAPDVGHLAPNTTLLDLSNKPVDLKSLRGDIVVLNFWYVACEPCQYEMPLLEEVYHTDQGQHVVVIGVNIADDAQTISSFVSRLGIDYPVLRDIGQHAVIDYRITSTPTSIVLDRHGVVRGRAAGAFTDTSALNKLIAPWLSQT